MSNLPPHNKIKQTIENKAVKTVLPTQGSICKNQYVFISADKNGNTNLVKFICWCDIDGHEVKTFLLDMNCTDKDTNGIVDVLEHSPRQPFPADVPVCIYGQCTDGSDGGTLEALTQALRQKP